MTPSDAVYVARMIRTLHDLGTPGYSTVFAYLQVSDHISARVPLHVLISQFFGDALPSCIFACTESEARNLGEPAFHGIDERQSLADSGSSMSEGHPCRP